MGRPVARTDHVATRVRNEAVIVLAQRKLFQRLAPGLMHAFIFWGFLVLFPTIVHAMGALIDPDFALPVIGGTRWFALVVDVFATLVAVGVGLAFFIRKLVRPKRFEGSHLREADFILLAILGIVATLLLWNADRIALGLNEAPAAWSPVANLLSGLFGRGSEATERALVWAHVLIILGFLTYIPHSKHLHRVRPLPGRLPRKLHRQGSVAQASDHGPPGPPLRGRPECPVGARRGRGPRVTAASPDGRDRRGRVGLRHLRRLRARVPGLDRAHRPHSRSPPEPRDGRVAVPTGGGRLAPQPRELVEPVGSAPGAAGSLGRRAGGARAGAGRVGARVPLLGGVRGLVRRPRAERRPGARAPVEQRGHRLRDPWTTGALHRRPCEADGARVPVPDPRRAERGGPGRRRCSQDRRELPPLLQHAGQRVPRLRWTVRGRPPYGAVGATRSRRPARTAARGWKESHLPRPLLPRATQRHLRRAPIPGAQLRRDAAARRALLLLRSGWREDVDGGARRKADSRRAGRGGRRHGGRHPRGRLSLLHDHARRRHQIGGQRPRREGRRAAHGRVPRVATRTRACRSAPDPGSACGSRSCPHTCRPTRG